MNQDIFEYVKSEKNNYEAGIGVLVAGNWHWRMYDHCNYSLLMKNGQFPLTQTKMGDRPQKNIILPILNVAYRTEGFDVKDIELYVNDSDKFHLSFLARKFYYNWAIENKFDTFIDDVVEALDYGFCLVKNVNSKRPEVVQPQQIAFCDQTDILSGTIALRHQYSIDQLVDTGNDLGWYSDKIDIAVRNARNAKAPQSQFAQENEAPDKSTEVFEVHGTFPDSWLAKDDNESYNSKLSPDKYSKQIHIITYTKDDKGNKQGICLFKGKEPKEVFKLLILKPIYGRAVGRGRVEELFEPQIWTNFNMIHMQNMLKEASKVVHITDDEAFTTRNNTKNIQGGEFLTVESGKKVGQLNTQPVNIGLFDKASLAWEQHARVTGSASDPALGLNPVSGTPLGTTQIVTGQGEGIHEFNRGKIATFIHEIHIDWIMDYLIADMNKGLKWIDDLSLDEMQKLAEDVMTNSFNQYIKDKILNGELVTEEELAPLRDKFKAQFMKSNKKFLEIVKGEFKDLPINLKVNVAGKQRDAGKMTEKLTNIFRTIFANPQGFMETMKIPGANKAFNDMLEASGLSQYDFTIPQSMQSQQPPQAPQHAQPSPIQSNQLQANAPVAQ